VCRERATPADTMGVWMRVRWLCAPSLDQALELEEAVPWHWRPNPQHLPALKA